MGRPPCCDKVGIKKGPWTPEEDIILVSYIQEHGPGNWRSVPTNTGLLRCSKSCRLRWTNYLRPGIRRGNFTPQEEGMIIHLQALLGNKWAAIASYLPQRTDNDIKNYWNTHLKKKIKKFQAGLDPQMAAAPSDSSTYHHPFVSSNSFIDRRMNPTTEDITSHTSNLRFNHGTSTTTTPTPTPTYASSTENISRLLEGWMRSSPKPNPNSFTDDQDQVVLQQQPSYSNFDNNNGSSTAASLFRGTNKSEEEEEEDDEEEDECHLGSNDELESILSFDNLNNIAKWEDNSSYRGNQTAAILDDKDNFIHDQRKDSRHELPPPPPPLSFLENWLLGESGGQVEEMMELPPIF